MIMDLALTGETRSKCFGDSMSPIIKSGSELLFFKEDDYEVGDIVFCKVKGRYIDAHKIIKKDQCKGFLIANNHGHENGWTKIVYGRVYSAAHIESNTKTWFKND